MKFIYQDLIEKEILKHEGIEISKNATFTIHNMTSGFLEHESGGIEVVRLFICSGQIFGVFDKSNNYYETEFTIFDIDFHGEHHLGCDVKLELDEPLNKANINGVIWELSLGPAGWSIEPVDKVSIKGNITIPALFEGKPVTTIWENSFAECDKLERVNIPDGITVIQCCAFYGCTALTSVTIPNSVKKIERSAFENCINLSSVTIPHTDITIEQDAFAGCPNLTFNTT